jgi:hypothetical protein
MENSKGKQLLSRPRSKYKYKMETPLKACCKDVNWNNLAQDRDQWLRPLALGHCEFGLHYRRIKY